METTYTYEVIIRDENTEALICFEFECLAEAMAFLGIGISKSVHGSDVVFAISKSERLAKGVIANDPVA